MSMSPMDEMQWFQPIAKTNETVTANTARQIVGQDPQRIGLIITNSGGRFGTVGPDAQISAGATDGIGLSTSLPPLILLQKDWGLLAQVAWLGSAPASGDVTFTIYQVLLKAWPQGGFDSDRQQNKLRPNGNSNGPLNIVEQLQKDIYNLFSAYLGTSDFKQ